MRPMVNRRVECSNTNCRTLISSCDGRRMTRCAKCVRLGVKV